MTDTGASLSLISNEIISKKYYKRDYKINLYGLMGKEMPIRTKGMVDITLILDNQNIETIFHVVDKKNSGPGDGYLGYDFLSLYKARIDLQNMYLGIQLNEKNVKCEKSTENIMEIPEINKNLNDNEYEPLKKSGEIWENRFNGKLEKSNAKNIS